jgi:hypothetical protein
VDLKSYYRLISRGDVCIFHFERAKVTKNACRLRLISI